MYKLHLLQHPDWHRTAVLVTATFISLKLFIIIVCFIFFFFSKIIPSFFVDKASCTRQFESELSLHSLASLFPIKKGFFLPLRLSCKESSTFSPSPSSSGSGDVTALWCSEPLRYKVGGPSKVFAMVVRDGTALLLEHLLRRTANQSISIIICYSVL